MPARVARPTPGLRNLALSQPIRAALAACAVLTACGATSSVADASHSAGKAIRASGPTPYRDGCVPGGKATGLESEPSIVAGRGDPRTVVVAWRQDADPAGNMEGGLPLTDNGAVSHGRGFRQFAFPGLSACDGGPTRYVGATDPWLAAGPRRTFWFAGLAFTAGNPGAVAVSRSTDGGESWSRSVLVDEDADDSEYDDKESIVADPVNPDRAWVAWAKFRRLPSQIPSPNLDTTFYVSRTDDGGRTWSPRVAVAYGGLLAGRVESAFPAQIVRLASGALVLVTAAVVPDITPSNLIPCFTDAPDCTGTVRLAASRSVDGGATWSAAAPIGSTRYLSPEIPGAGESEAANYLFSAAAGPDGRLWVTTAEATGPASTRILLYRSPDAGRSWRRDTPTLGAGLRLLPHVAASPSGTVLLWHQTVAGRPGFVQWRFASSPDGRRWTERPLAPPTDVHPPKGGDPAESLFLGHYFGLAPAGRDFVAAFTQGPPQAAHGPSDVFVTRLRDDARRLRIRVAPRRLRAGRTTRIRARVTVRSDGVVRPIRGVRVRSGRAAARTNSHGVARLRVRLRRGRRSLAVTARRKGYVGARATLRVR